ncbi:MAG: cupin domain-containing protein, partial [Oscillospiraceae bacterium]|nr:cupin domain-containing protein [Oscillospiraceae bacterium]
RRVSVDNVLPLEFGDYASRMILDHVITGREDCVQINHGTLRGGASLDGAVHDGDEIYYILSGRAELTLGDDRIEIGSGQVIFIPAGTFHALDNSAGTEDLTLLTIWRDWRHNEAYTERLRRWGTSFRTVGGKDE